MCQSIQTALGVLLCFSLFKPLWEGNCVSVYSNRFGRVTVCQSIQTALGVCVSVYSNRFGSVTVCQSIQTALGG